MYLKDLKIQNKYKKNNSKREKNMHITKQHYKVIHNACYSSEHTFVLSFMNVYSLRMSVKYTYILSSTCKSFEPLTNDTQNELVPLNSVKFHVCCDI